MPGARPQLIAAWSDGKRIWSSLLLFGRRYPPETHDAAPEGVRKIAARFGVSPDTVQRISRPFQVEAVAVA